MKLALTALLPSAAAHVRLLNAGTTNGLVIRNAASANSDGVFSVNGACGGNAAFGANGIAEGVKAGDTLTFSVAYNGGHASAANAFGVAMQCGTTGAALTQNALEANAAKITSCGTVAAPGGSNGSPYTVTCQVCSSHRRRRPFPRKHSSTRALTRFAAHFTLRSSRPQGTGSRRPVGRAPSLFSTSAIGVGAWI